MVATNSHLWTWCTIVLRTIFCYQCSCFKHSLVLIKSECPPNPALCQCWHYSQDKWKNALYTLCSDPKGFLKIRKLCKICSWLLQSERCLSLITPCTDNDQGPWKDSARHLQKLSCMRPFQLNTVTCDGIFPFKIPWTKQWIPLFCCFWL